MRAFMITLLECSAVMSALALVYMLLNRLLAKRYAEKWRYYAWLIIIVGLIIPFRPTFGNVAIKIDAPEILDMPVIEAGGRLRFDPYDPYYDYTVNPKHPAYDTEPYAQNPPPPADSAEAAGETAEAPAGKFDVSAIFINILSGISWWDIAVIVWLCGMTAFIVYQIMKHRHFMKMTNRWREKFDDEQISELFHSLKTEMKISRQIDLHLCPFVASPMLVGFVKPRILLPETDFKKDELRLIIKHELVHYKRKDVLYRFLLLIATAIHWFNPVVHLLARAVDMGCEVSCDDEVVKGEDIETRRYYSNTILGVVRYQKKIKTLLSTHLNGGKKIMKKRLSSIMDIGKKRGGVIIACLIVVGVLGTGLVLAINTNRPLDDTPKRDMESQTDEYGNEITLNALEQLPETDTLVLWRTISNHIYLDPAVKIFQRIYPDVKVEVQDFMSSPEKIQEYYTIVQTEVSSGKGPDLLLMDDTSSFPDIYKVMELDIFCDLNDFIANDPDFNLGDYNKVVMESGVYKGKRCFMPVSYYRDILLTTKETLTAAEINPDNIRSFDGYTAEIKKFLEKYASTKLVYNQQQLYFYMFFPWCGIEYIDYETKTVNVDGEDFKKVMEAYKDIYTQDWESNNNYQHYLFMIPDMLKSNKIVFGRNYYTTTTLEYFMLNYSALSAHGYSPIYFPFPSINGKNIAKVGNMVAILNSSQNKANAYRFLKILLSEEMQAKSENITDATSLNWYFPVLNSAIDIRAKNQLESEFIYEYEGKSISISREIMQDYVNMVTDIDSCQILIPGPLAQIFSNYMVPYFKGEDTYENCLDKARNWLELYLSE